MGRVVTVIQDTDNYIGGENPAAGNVLYWNASAWDTKPAAAAGVTSFNTRTGAVTLSGADVTTALGFTPPPNSRQVIAGAGLSGGGDLSADRTLTLALTGAIVNTALGFTPESSALSHVNTFNTRSGAVTLSSGDVTTALTYTPENAANKAAAGGYASLDGGGKVPTAQLPASVIGGVDYQGTWNATTNSPTLASGVGTKGFYYKVSVAGSTSIDGNANWHVGDWIVFDGVVWEKIDNFEAVTSVFSRVGDVVLLSGDVTTALGFAPVTNARTISAGAGLSGGGDLSADRTLTLALTGGIVNTALGYTAANAARLVSSGTGLSGGGDLSADRTLSLANTAVTPAAYTNANITIDAQGRITAAASGSAGVTAHSALTGLTTGDDHTQYIFNAPASSARNVIQPTGAAIIPFILKGFASQTANLLTLQNSSDTLLSAFSKAGNLGLGADAVSAVRLAIDMGQTANSCVLLNNCDNTGAATIWGASTTTPYGSGNCTTMGFLLDGTGWLTNYAQGGSGALKGHRWQIAGVNALEIKSSGAIGIYQAPTASAPAYVEGALYYDTTLHEMRFGGATAWQSGNLLLTREFYEGGGVLTAGTKLRIVCPFAGTITSNTCILDQSGSVSVEVRKCSYAQYDGGSTHPVTGDKISASAPIVVSSATKSTDSTLSGWTTAVSAGDVIEFSLSSVTGATLAFVQLVLTKS